MVGAVKGNDPKTGFGFDDTKLASMASPPLTTVRQPLWEMGGVALRTEHVQVGKHVHGVRGDDEEIQELKGDVDHGGEV